MCVSLVLAGCGSGRRLPALLWVAGLATLLLACGPKETPDTHAPRALDTRPTKTKLATPLPAGRAEAKFALNTGGDQMAQRPKEAGLMVVVRVDGKEYRQTIASCRDPGLGSALGGETERELQVATCRGEYWLISEVGHVSVMRVDRKPEGEEVARIPLPAGVRAVAAPDR